jgi:hypothetical protein
LLAFKPVICLVLSLSGQGYPIRIEHPSTSISNALLASKNSEVIINLPDDLKTPAKFFLVLILKSGKN